MVLYYKRVCLYCLKTSDKKYSRLKDEESRKILLRHAEASRDFVATQAIKRELFDEKEPCEFCGHLGCFDVWNTEMDNYILWSEPRNDYPSIRLEFQRIDGGEIHLKFITICEGTLDIILSFLDLVPLAISKLSEEIFIKKENSFLVAHLFLNDKTGKSQINRFRFAGFSKEEILSNVDSIKGQYMRRIMERED